MLSCDGCKACAPQELDFRNEAANAARCAANFGSGRSRMSGPTALPPTRHSEPSPPRAAAQTDSRHWQRLESGKEAEERTAASAKVRPISEGTSPSPKPPARASAGEAKAES